MNTDKSETKRKDLTQRAQRKSTAKTPALKAKAGGRYKVKSLRRVLLFDVGFLLQFGGF